MLSKLSSTRNFGRMHISNKERVLASRQRKYLQRWEWVTWKSRVEVRLESSQILNVFLKAKPTESANELEAGITKEGTSKIGLSVIVWQDGASVDGGKLLEEQWVEQTGVLSLIHYIWEANEPSKKSHQVGGSWAMSNLYVHIWVVTI